SILGSDDVMSIMPYLDGVVLIASAGVSKFNEIEEAAALIPEDKLLCAVLNKCRHLPHNAVSD
ncbi:MAG: hypothetical protein AAF788_06380, partial [Pseudomonadota bacterium]